MTTWEKIVGHRWAIDLLRDAILRGRTSHAYLFTGPAQIGKTTIARTVAQALNCTDPNPNQRPCGNCRSCQLIAIDRHPDVSLLLPEVSGRGKLTLKIEAIRELQHDLNLPPMEARFRVAILKRFDAATPGAANAFLKTLEEPPRFATLLLTANEADSLLPTISSRCQILALRPLPTVQIQDALATHTTLPTDQVAKLAHMADGRLGWALAAAATLELLAEREGQLDMLLAALGGDRVGRFALAGQLSREPEMLPDILRIWLSWWRDLALLTWGNGTLAMLSNIDRLEELQRFALAWSPTDIRRGLEQTNRAIWQLEQNANTRLALEVLLLTYPYQLAAGLPA
jgi:DNA polymerase-3 subunit delta'